MTHKATLLSEGKGALNIFVHLEYISVQMSRSCCFCNDFVGPPASSLSFLAISAKSSAIGIINLHPRFDGQKTHLSSSYHKYNQRCDSSHIGHSERDAKREVNGIAEGFDNPVHFILLQNPSVDVEYKDQC